jgi:phosphoenolpyruvate carboxykinase (ATP)
MPLHPSEYARLLGKKIEEHRVKCWLVNTGWTAARTASGIGFPSVIPGPVKCRTGRKTGSCGVCHGTGIRPGNSEGMSGDSDRHPDAERKLEKQGGLRSKAGELAKSFQDQFKQYETLVADEIKNAGPVG